MFYKSQNTNLNDANLLNNSPQAYLLLIQRIYNLHHTFKTLVPRNVCVVYNYSTLGYGFILRAVGNTAIAENVYAHIGVRT